ncbi:MAG: SET domain-containing protein-lysine N-methyltransferase [Candidatus Latescibacterota bacterium]
MDIHPPKKVKVVRIKGKGRGVVAAEQIRSGEIIEVCPLLILSDLDAEHAITKSDCLKFYALELVKTHKQVLHLGYGMIYNHSSNPNSEIEYQAGEDFIIFRALVGIEPGQEITYDYDFNDNKVEFLPLE